MENFKENLPVQPKKKEIPTEIKKETKICLLDDLMDRLDTLPKDNLAVEYCNKRKIPKEQFKNLYYVDDIRKVVQLNEKYKEHLTIEEPRLFIPFFNFDGSLVGATMRALRGEARRYINIKVKEDVPNIFGLLNVDKEKPLYVCEGPFDSMFLDNAIAVGGTSFGKIKDLSINFKKIIYIYDNQPYNKDLCKLISRQIEQGSNVVIWPNNIEQKDINEMCLKGKDVKSLVSSNVYSGLTAKMKFLQWRKC